MLSPASQAEDAPLTQAKAGSATGRFFDLEYKLPPQLVKDKKAVTVRFLATAGNETPTVFGVRIVHGDSAR